VVLDPFFPLHAAGDIHTIGLHELHGLGHVVRVQAACQDDPAEGLRDNGKVPVEGLAGSSRTPSR